MNLTNSWMNSVNFLASMAHALFSYGTLLTVARLASIKVCFVAFLAILIYAAVKEFWYDANYELPKQTAADNWLDFSTYTLGGLIGLIVILFF